MWQLALNQVNEEFKNINDSAPKNVKVPGDPKEDGPNAWRYCKAAFLSQ